MLDRLFQVFGMERIQFTPKWIGRLLRKVSYVTGLDPSFCVKGHRLISYEGCAPRGSITYYKCKCEHNSYPDSYSEYDQ